jgi:hypothetical protein
MRSRPVFSLPLPSVLASGSFGSSSPCLRFLDREAATSSMATAAKKNLQMIKKTFFEEHSSKSIYHTTSWQIPFRNSTVAIYEFVTGTV